MPTRGPSGDNRPRSAASFPGGKSPGRAGRTGQTCPQPPGAPTGRPRPPLVGLPLAPARPGARQRPSPKPLRSTWPTGGLPDAQPGLRPNPGGPPKGEGVDGPSFLERVDHLPVLLHVRDDPSVARGVVERP